MSNPPSKGLFTTREGGARIAPCEEVLAVWLESLSLYSKEPSVEVLQLAANSHIDWWAGGAGAVVGAIIGSFIGSCVPLWWATRRRREESLGEIAAMHVEFHLTNVALTGLSSQHFSRGESWRRYIGCQ